MNKLFKRKKYKQIFKFPVDNPAAIHYTIIERCDDMSAKRTAINQHFYPYIGQVKELPVFLAGIGGTEYQCRVDRPEGYCWDQILFCAKGGGTLKFDSTTVRITDGCYFFLPADYPHEYVPDEARWDVRWIVFGGSACKQTLRELGMTKPLVVRLEDGSSLQRLYDKMFVALRSDRIYGNYICSGLMYQYLMEFHRLASGSGVPGGADRSDIILPALNYIDEHYREDFSVAVLAEISGVSQQYLCRKFRQTMNLRPNEYVSCRRIQEAKRLLTETDIPAAEVARLSGFADAGYFCTVFRKLEKLTPTQYRSLYKGKR